MADEITITHGTVTVVDSGVLREHVSRVIADSMRVSDALDMMENAYYAMYREGVDSFGVEHVRVMVEGLRFQLWTLAENGEYTADLYEVAELKATMGSLPEGPELEALQNRLAELLAGRPGLNKAADELLNSTFFGGIDGLKLYNYWRISWPFFNPMEGVLIGSATTLWIKILFHLKGWGWVKKGEQLRPQETKVQVYESTEKRQPALPGGFGDAVDRLGENDDTQVSVEVYTMPDGTREAIVYIGGTEALFDPKTAWNMPSNVDMMFDREKSESYVAVELALEAAGLEPGDTVNFFAYSQGAIIAAHMEASGLYDVGFNVTFGSPTHVSGTDSQQIAVRHTDDLVAGSVTPPQTGYGNSDSFIVTRERARTDMPIYEQDLAPSISAHHLDAYRETAEMIDNSDDPRVLEFFAKMDRFREAESVERKDYKAIIP